MNLEVRHAQRNQVVRCYRLVQEGQGVLALPSSVQQAEVNRGHQEDQGVRSLQDLQEVHCHQGLQSLPLVQGIRERQADRYLPLYQEHRKDLRDLGIRERQSLPSVQGSPAGQEYQEYPCLPSRRRFLGVHGDPVGQVHLLFQVVQVVLEVLWGPAEPVLEAQEGR